MIPADYDFEAHKELVVMQPGDVPITYADTSAFRFQAGDTAERRTEEVRRGV